MSLIKNIKQYITPRNIIFLVIICVAIYFFLYKNKKKRKARRFRGKLKIDMPIKIVNFYSPKCHHSMNFMAEWNKLENSPELKKIGVKVEKVDCEKNPELCQKNGVDRFPLVHLYTAGGNTIVYDGPRKKENLVRFCQSFH